MSRSLNKISLIGNVGQDPEIRSTQTGGRVAQFSLATTRTWNTPGGEKQEKTEWHRCVAWNAGTRGQGLADVIEKYVKKGDRLYVEGRVEYRQYQDKDNNTKYATDVIVRELLMLGGGRGGSDFDGESGRESNRDGGSRRYTSSKAGGSAPAAGAGEFDDFPGALQDEEDDLPF